MSKINDLQLAITKLLTSEQAKHAELITEINSRRPHGKDSIIESLSVIHRTRIELLEKILVLIKEIK